MSRLSRRKRRPSAGVMIEDGRDAEIPHRVQQRFAAVGHNRIEPAPLTLPLPRSCPFLGCNFRPAENAVCCGTPRDELLARPDFPGAGVRYLETALVMRGCEVVRRLHAVTATKMSVLDPCQRWPTVTKQAKRACTPITSFRCLAEVMASAGWGSSAACFWARTQKAANQRGHDGRLSGW